jgi:glycosyltransferase involved in cell wall biosynthesis
VMASSDLVILPSRKVYEAFPYVVLEAMALGKPVLATRVGAVTEMLDIGTDRPCGVCVAPGDLAELKEALARLLREASARQHMGENGRKRVSAVYAAPVVVARLIRLWEAIAKDRV